jgi:hypothetical protein
MGRSDRATDAWTENAVCAGDRIARIAALKEEISEQLRDSYRNRAHVRFGVPRHHAGPTKRKEGHTNTSDPLMMVVASTLVAADAMHAQYE